MIIHTRVIIISILPTQKLYSVSYKELRILDELVCCGCSIQFIIGEFRQRTC